MPRGRSPPGVGYAGDQRRHLRDREYEDEVEEELEVTRPAFGLLLALRRDELLDRRGVRIGIIWPRIADQLPRQGARGKREQVPP